MARSISRTVTGLRPFRCSIPARLLGSVGWPLGVAAGIFAIPLSLSTRQRSASTGLLTPIESR